MKIKPEHKEKLFALLDERLSKIGWDVVKKHKELSLGNNKAMRFRWDLLWASKIKIGDSVGMSGDIALYDYMNDEHIDTVLRKYVEERKL